MTNFTIKELNGMGYGKWWDQVFDINKGKSTTHKMYGNKTQALEPYPGL